ncbi:MAG: YraN family protein [Leptospiraceae bacterium]|nr:YraN family protein [Leptospiraceae bacterium]
MEQSLSLESLVEGDLVALLQARGISVNQTSQRLKKVYNNQDFEIDIVAKNGLETVFVEVKTTMVPEHVEHFVKKLEIINRSDFQPVAF